MKDQNIYLDYAAATPCLPEVVKAMMPFFDEVYGNPSSIHFAGQAAKTALEDARLNVSKILNCSSDEVIFTGSGTESITLALKGAAKANPGKNHIITSQIEHPAVLSVCEQLQSEGFEITYIPVDHFGIVDISDIERTITDKTLLVSVMYANNEIGTIQPINEISQIAHKHNVLFHTDACQAAGSLTIDVNDLKCDLMTLNGSKIYGPKGIGLLYIKRGISLEPLIPGGGQERGYRGGTENVPAAVGFAASLKWVEDNKDKQNCRLLKLRDKLTQELLLVPGCILNGHPTQRLANNINVSFDGIDGQTIVGKLSQNGIACSSSSACSSANPDPSHVLLAIGKSYQQSFEGLRISLGKDTLEDDINKFVTILKEIIAKF